MTDLSSSNPDQAWFVAENGGIVRFAILDRDTNPHFQHDTPRVAISYEGPMTAPDVDYTELSIYALDGQAMVGVYSVDSEDLPEVSFYYLPEDVIQQITPQVRRELGQFIQHNKAWVQQLAYRKRRVNI